MCSTGGGGSSRGGELLSVTSRPVGRVSRACWRASGEGWTGGSSNCCLTDRVREGEIGLGRGVLRRRDVEGVGVEVRDRKGVRARYAS